VGLPIVLPIFGGLNALLYFMPLADLITFVATVFVIGQMNRELNRDIEEHERRAAGKSAPAVQG